MSSKTPKRLVLHFDVNSTITAVDSTEPGNNVQNANMLLSKSYYGKVIDGEWVLNDPTDWFTDSIGNISYYDYLKSQYDDYKKRSFRYTHPGMPGQCFAGDVPKIAKAFDQFLFKSFIDLLRSQRHEDTTIVFRTFGPDGEDVLTNLVDSKFYAFSDERMIKCSILYDDGGVSSLVVRHPMSVVYVDGAVEHLNRLIAHNKDKNFLVRENFDHWNNNGRSAQYGKHLLGEEDAVHIFFDDNECVHIVGGANNAHFVRVNSLFALQDDNYFIKRVHEIISNQY